MSPQPSYAFIRARARSRYASAAARLFAADAVSSIQEYSADEMSSARDDARTATLPREYRCCGYA